MKKIFYTMMAMAVMCFVSCTEKNVPSDEEKSGGSSTETGSISANMEDYVGTWNVSTDDTEKDGKLLCVQLRSDKTCIFILELSDEDAAEYNVQKGAKVAFFADEWWIKKNSYGGKETVSLGFSGKHEGYFTAFFGYTYTVNKVEKNKLTLSWYEGGVGDIMTYYTRTNDGTMEQHLSECFDNGNGNEGGEEDKTPSMNMTDYVGTWLFEGDANLMGMICIQLKSDGTGTYFDGGFTYGSWSVTKDVWTEQEFVKLYIEGSKTTNNGNSSNTRNMSYSIKILETGKNKIKASDIIFNNIFYLVRTTEDAINNYSEE